MERIQKNIKVLVVDDAELITARISAMVRETESVSDVFVSAGYAAAIDVLAEKQPDIVLLDIHLPQKNGMELLSYIRKNYPDIKVIMVTNKASDYYREICAAAGAHHFVDKSKEFETIPAIIASYTKS